jgi:uncharacterized protein YneF (UPF0154 family)
MSFSKNDAILAAGVVVGVFIARTYIRPMISRVL